MSKENIDFGIHHTLADELKNAILDLRIPTSHPTGKYVIFYIPTERTPPGTRVIREGDTLKFKNNGNEIPSATFSVPKGRDEIVVWDFINSISFRRMAEI